MLYGHMFPEVDDMVTQRVEQMRREVVENEAEAEEFAAYTLREASSESL